MSHLTQHRLLTGALIACAWLRVGCPAPLAQASGPRTEIIVIGTVHNPTDNYDLETLIRILKRVHPDKLLLELDSSFFDSSFSLVEKYRDVSLEAQAAVRFQEMSGIKLRPYDIEGRNRFYEEHDYFTLQQRLNRELGRLYDNKLMPLEASLFFEALRSLSSIRDSFGRERPEVINSAACDTAIERKQYYMYQGIKRIIELTPTLREFAAFWSLADDFWVRRNNEMAKNIVKYSKEFQGQRVVVLCGFEHRYYLIKSLKERGSKDNFALREYWSY